MTPKLDPDKVPVYDRAGGLIVAGAVAGLVGALIVGAGAVVAPNRTLYGYLSLHCGLTSLGLGALVLLMIVHVMNAKWPVPIRRLLETLVAPLPFLALAFVPIAAWLGRIYSWAPPVPEHVPHHIVTLIEAKRAYLNPAFWTGRAVFYWVCWLGVAWRLRAWSARQDYSAEAVHRVRQRWLSAAAMPLVALTLTFAAFDWIMALEPAWFSTVFGIEFFAGGFVAAIAVLTLTVATADRRAWLPGLVSDSHYYALGRLLLAFVVFWAYIVFFQFFIIWTGNRPEEVQWYTHRLADGWWIVACVLGLGHFVIPFVMLLSYRVKRHRAALSGLAAWIVAMHLLDMHWKVVPALQGATIVHWVDLGALSLLGGGSLAFAAWRLRGRPIAPRMDPALDEGARYHRV